MTGREIAEVVRSAPGRDVPTLRRIRRGVTKRLEDLEGAEVLDLARRLLEPEEGVPDGSPTNWCVITPRPCDS